MKRKLENLKPVGISWFITSLLLLGGMLYEVFHKGGFGLLSVIFFVSQAVYWVVRLYLNYKKK